MHRAMSRPFFAKEKISDFDCFDRHTESLVNVFAAHAEKKEAFDIQVGPKRGRNRRMKGFPVLLRLTAVDVPPRSASLTLSMYA